MTDQLIAENILEQAADWYDRLDELSENEKHEYACWLAEDDQHQQAMLWLQNHLGEHEEGLMEVLSAYDIALLPEKQHTAEYRHHGDALIPRLLTLLLPKPALAAAVVMLLAVLVGYPLWQQHTLLPAAQPLSYHTNTAEQRNEQLADGSEIYMNAGSDLSVMLAAQQREVELTRGEAYFSVAADRQRPFFVYVGTAKIRVVGTAFNVDRMPDQTLIAVEHGHVQVTAGGQEWHLLAGDGLRIRGDQADTFHSDSISGWRDGWRDVSNESVLDVVSHLQRYSTRPIKVEAVSASQSFSGRYSQSDVEGTLTLIATLFDLSLQINDDLIVLSGHEQETN